MTSSIRTHTDERRRRTSKPRPQHTEYSHLTAEELVERVNAARKAMGYADTRVSYQGRGWYHRRTSGLAWAFKERRYQVEDSLRRFEERARQQEADRPLREKTAKDEHRRRSLTLAAGDMLAVLRQVQNYFNDCSEPSRAACRAIVHAVIEKAEGCHDHDWHRDQFNIEVCAHCGEERGEGR